MDKPSPNSLINKSQAGTLLEDYQSKLHLLKLAIALLLPLATLTIIALTISDYSEE
jgi:hypothetical protein